MSITEAKLLLSRVVVIDRHPNLIDVSSDIAAELNMLAPQKSELASEYLEGWWLSRICLHLMGEADQGIPVHHLILKAHEIGKTLTEGALPIDEPSHMEIKEYSQGDEQRVFVRQMSAIKETLHELVADQQIALGREAYAIHVRGGADLVAEYESSGFDSLKSSTEARSETVDDLIARLRLECKNAHQFGGRFRYSGVEPVA